MLTISKVICSRILGLVPAHTRACVGKPEAAQRLVITIVSPLSHHVSPLSSVSTAGTASRSQIPDGHFVLWVECDFSNWHLVGYVPILYVMPHVT